MNPDTGAAGELDVPTLTDIVAPGAAALPAPVLAAIQAELTTRVLKLSEELLHQAAREMQAILLERVCDRLRAQLPELIDDALRASLQELTNKPRHG